MNNTNMLPRYDTKLFCEIFEDAETFSTEYKASGLYDATTSGSPAVIHLNNSLSDTNINILYYLLYAKYANNPIANYDENQFKYKLWAIIFQYGPAWAKKLDIQNKVRELTDDEKTDTEKLIEELKESLKGTDTSQISLCTYFILCSQINSQRLSFVLFENCNLYLFLSFNPSLISCV